VAPVPASIVIDPPFPSPVPAVSSISPPSLVLEVEDPSPPINESLPPLYSTPSPAETFKE